MPINTLLIDLDDTLYPASIGLWSLIRQRIDLYMYERLNIPWDSIPELRHRLFREYGTTLRGLQATIGLDAQDYLAFVHAVPVEEYLHPDPELKRILLRCPQSKVIFTNADKGHALRVLRALQIADQFDQIIDILAVAPYCKPMPEAYSAALRLAGVANPCDCLVFDDSTPNLAAARLLGCSTVLVGDPNPNFSGDYCIPSLHALSRLPGSLPILSPDPLDPPFTGAQTRPSS
jgi:putative hydrolase of the HAD superfamily